MNIVIITDYAYVNGGASKISLGSAKALADAGNNVVLFTAVGPVARDLQNVRGLSTVCTNQFEILRDPNRVRAGLQGLWNTKSSEAMSRVLDDLDPAQTVLHVHLWAKALSSSVVRTGITKRFPVLLTLHDFLTACPNGTLFNHKLQQICSLRPMTVSCCQTNCDPRRFSNKLWRVGRQFVQQNAGMLPGSIRDFISISDTSETILRPLLPTGARFHRVNNFVDVVKSEAVDVEANSAFVYAGRLVREKGVLLWSHCARELGVPTVFIGDGELRESIRSSFPAASITGWLSEQETRAQMRFARALVFPSLWHETQGLVVAEAAAMGIPSIVSDHSAAREWVENGKTGLWFRSGDAGDLADKVRAVRDSPGLATELGRDAYQRYWQNPPTIRKHVTELETLYKTLLAEARSTQN